MNIIEGAAKAGGKILNESVKNNGNFLFLSAAAGWVLASMAQTIGLITNKEIGKEEKKFLGYEFSERRGKEGLHHLAGGESAGDGGLPGGDAGLSTDTL